MVAKKVKVAVIGLGNMGQHHVRILSEIAHLVAVCDANENLAKRTAKQYKTGFHTTADDLISKNSLDCVTIAVPTKFHHTVALKTLGAGIPTLVEKPITNSLPKAQELIDLAKKKKVLLSVGHVERFNPAVQKAKELIVQKKLGDIVSLLAVRVGVVPPQSKGSDVVIDLAVHDIDVFNFLLDQYPRSSSVTRKKIFSHNFSDVASVKLDYNRAVGLVQTNWITPIKRRALYITGTHGFVEVDYIKQQLTLYSRLLDIKPAGDFYELVSKYDASKQDVYVMREEPLKLELLSFIDKIDTKGPDEICLSAIKALEISLGPH
jgi:UDP-N-acetylglucosamine 3-dehydrogenase